MKKLIGLLVAGLTISVLMTGCNKPTEGDNATPPSTTGGKAPTDKMPPPGSTTGAATGTTGASATTGAAGTAGTTGATPPTTGGATTGK